jgi:glucan 1,3-beta-glucosidase
VRLLGWARALDLRVWLDLHAAPGSQNGFDNSGRLGALEWDQDPAHVARTVRVLGKLAKAVKEEGFSDVVDGVGALNEPGPFVKVYIAPVPPFCWMGVDKSREVVREDVAAQPP